MNRERQKREWMKNQERFIEEAGGAFRSDLVFWGNELNDQQAMLILSWVAQLREVHPMCLFCDLQWTDFHTEDPPAAFHILMGWKTARHAMVSGICEECADNPDLHRYVVAKLRVMFGDELTIQPPSTMTEH